VGRNGEAPFSFVRMPGLHLKNPVIISYYNIKLLFVKQSWTTHILMLYTIHLSSFMVL
jgi:hypothetical protein